jgi:hypothetical protein
MRDGAAPAGGSRKPVLGRRWFAVRPHSGAVFNGWRRATNGLRTRPGPCRGGPPCPRPEARPQGPKSPEWCAGWHALSRGERSSRKLAMTQAARGAQLPLRRSSILGKCSHATQSHQPAEARDLHGECACARKGCRASDVGRERRAGALGNA